MAIDKKDKFTIDWVNDAGERNMDLIEKLEIKKISGSGVQEEFVAEVFNSDVYVGFKFNVKLKDGTNVEDWSLEKIKENKDNILNCSIKEIIVIDPTDLIVDNIEQKDGSKKVNSEQLANIKNYFSEYTIFPHKEGKCNSVFISMIENSLPKSKGVDVDNIEEISNEVIKNSDELAGKKRRGRPKNI